MVTSWTCKVLRERNHRLQGARHCALLQWRRLKPKVKCEGSSSFVSSHRYVPGSFNMGFIGSTFTALPRVPCYVMSFRPMPAGSLKKVLTCLVTA